MNIVSDPKSIPASSILSPEANQAAALATATGVLTVDLDALVANWRKLEKTAVPAECAGVVKADAYGCGIEPVARALASAGCKTFFVATLEEARAARAAVPAAAIYTLNGFFQNTGAAYAGILEEAVQRVDGGGRHRRACGARFLKCRHEEGLAAGRRERARHWLDPASISVSLDHAGAFGGNGGLLKPAPVRDEGVKIDGQ